MRHGLAVHLPALGPAELVDPQHLSERQAVDGEPIPPPVPQLGALVASASAAAAPFPVLVGTEDEDVLGSRQVEGSREGVLAHGPHGAVHLPPVEKDPALAAGQRPQQLDLVLAAPARRPGPAKAQAGQAGQAKDEADLPLGGRQVLAGAGGGHLDLVRHREARRGSGAGARGGAARRRHGPARVPGHGLLPPLDLHDGGRELRGIGGSGVPT